MATLTLLGTGASLSGPGRTTTMLAAESHGSVILIDCGGDPVERMITAGLDPRHIDLLVLTHGHPDHLCGFPLLMQKLWLAGRSRPLDVLGPQRALTTARRLFEVFDTSGWEGLPEVRWLPVAAGGTGGAWRGDQWTVSTAPARHGRMPTIGVRLQPDASEGAAVHSSDTEYAESIVELARGASLLTHEATGAFPGHSTASDAARVAARAGVERLVLVHLPPRPDPEDLDASRRIFAGVELGRDGSAHAF